MTGISIAYQVRVAGERPPPSWGWQKAVDKFMEQILSLRSTGTYDDYARTIGGNNRNVAAGAFSFAGQDTTTVGGTALGRGRVITNGGGNLNVARGFASTATQSTTTLGGTAFGHGASITNGGFNSNIASGAFSSADQQVVTLGGTAGRHGLSVVDGGANKNAAVGFGSSASQAFCQRRTFNRASSRSTRARRIARTFT